MSAFNCVDATTIRMTARYSHLNPAFLGETMSKLDGVSDNLFWQGVANQKLLVETTAVTAESTQFAAIV